MTGVPARARRAWRALIAADVDLSTIVGSVALSNPVMTASGTVGHGDELAGYLALDALGAVVVKSISAGAWAGNPAPRVHQSPAGMLNSVGLQGPGMAAWARDDLPRLQATGATVVVSIWGKTVEEFVRAAEGLEGLEGLAAVEVNVSCPNLDRRIFAHSAPATGQVIRAVATATGLPLWAKLSPNVAALDEIASAANDAGASAVTLVNTVAAMAIDIERRRPVLGGGGGGLSGAAVHPVAVRAVFDVHAALPELPIVGVGGIMRGEDAVEMMMAGAHAVQVGTATFRDPRAPRQILDQLEGWCARHGIRRVSDLIGAAHG